MHLKHSEVIVVTIVNAESFTDGELEEGELVSEMRIFGTQ